MTGPALAAAAGLGFGVFQTLNRRAVGGMKDAYLATFLQLLVALGVLSPQGAREALGDLGPTVAFLAALLVLADGCRRAGLFGAVGAAMAVRARGGPRRLLGLVFAAAAATTAVLSLDATVVLLTPVVFATAGSSQAMKTAWIEDLLSLVPPISFLVAARFARKGPDAEYINGRARAYNVAFVVSAVALTGVGLGLVFDGLHVLVTGTRPTIGAIAGATPKMTATWLIIRWAFGPSKRSRMTVRLTIVEPPAARPWATRPTSSHSSDGANAHATDATAYTSSEPMITGLRPTASDSGP